MKQRKHINELWLEGLSAWLRANNRAADAAILDGVDPATFTRSGYSSGGIYGSSGNPTKGNGGKITIDNLSYTPAVLKETGETISGRSPDLSTLMAQVPPELRIKYIGSLPASSSTVWDPATNGIDMSKPGCRCYGMGGANGLGYIVIIGSDEDPADPAVIEKYLPFTMGLVKADNYGTPWYGSAYTYRQTKNLWNMTFNVWVWKSTSPAPAEKPVNQNLPLLNFRTVKNEAKPGYTTIPAFSVTPDYESLRGKYSSKVHFYRPILDALEKGLRNAGNTEMADKIKAVDPTTFVPFQITYDNTNKKFTYVGAQCSKTKQYFAGITFDIYQYNGTVTRMYPAHLSWIYTAESGLNWTMVTTQAIATASKSTALIADDEYRYFFKHIPKGTVITKEMILDAMPFDMTGINYTYPTIAAAATTITFNWYNELRENQWGGASTCAFRMIADL